MGPSSLSGSSATCSTAPTTSESQTARFSWRPYRVHGWLVVFAGAAFFLGAQFAVGVQKGEKQLRADTVSAGRFELIVPNGQKAALLCIGPKGGGLISFYDEKEVLRLAAGLSDDGLTVDRGRSLDLDLAREGRRPGRGTHDQRRLLQRTTEDLGRTGDSRG